MFRYSFVVPIYRDALLGFGLTLVLSGRESCFSWTISPAYTSTMSAIIFFGGIQILVIGVASLYIGRVLKEVQSRPLYVLRDRYKIDSVDHV